MSTRNGLLRIAHAVKVLGDGAGYLIALGAAALVVLPFRKLDADGAFIAGAMLVIAAACAGIGRGLAWIIEGFAGD